MKMSNMSKEIKVGLIVLMAILLALYFFGKTASFRHRTYDLKTYFVYAGDLKTDAIVKLTGIEVGRVKSTKFIYDKNGTKVECILELDSSAKVRKDSIAYVGTTGFVGDAYVGMTPGTSEEFLKKNDVVASEDPMQMRLLMKKADQIAANLDTILAEVKSVVVDNRASMDNIILNVEATTKNFEEFSEDVKQHPWKLLFKGE